MTRAQPPLTIDSRGEGWTGNACTVRDTVCINHPILYIPYSRKYWWELNLAVGSQMAIAKVLANFNLAVRYGIAIHIYASKKFWRILIWRSLR